MSDYYKFLTSCATPTTSYQQGKVYELSDETLINEFLNADYIELYDGTLEITENGTYDVADYENVDVEVSGGSNLTPNPTWIDTNSGGYTHYLITELDFDGVDLTGFYSRVGFNAFFAGHTVLKTIKNFNLGTIKPTELKYMFQQCSALEELPAMDTSICKDFSGFCDRCTNLKNVPIYQMSVNNTSVKIGYMYGECPSLTNQSLSNIVDSLITIIPARYSGNKTLAYVGLSQEQSEYCATLPNWTTLEERGWTTGY